MTIGSSWTRIRNAIARRLARPRALRSPPGVQAAPVRAQETDPPPPAIPLPPDLAALTPIAPMPDEAIGATPAAPSSDASASREPAIAVDVTPGIRIARAPGRFETDAELALRPKLYDARHTRREFMTYVPAGWSAEARSPLIVLCHGCKQTPEEFVRGTRIATLADERGYLLLMPRQSQWANPWRCWNWFDPSTANGGGETAIVAAQLRFVRQRYRADARRVAVVGISAGAALAAAMGVRYPRHVHAVVAHSGLACGAASAPITAGEVMKYGPNTDVDAIGAEARARQHGDVRVPLLAIHGASDPVVAQVNATALVRQYLRFNGHPAVDGVGEALDGLPCADATIGESNIEGRDATTREWRIDGRLVVRHVVVDDLGHAWSGGDGALPFNDPRAPDASRLVAEFLGEALA